MRCGNQHETLAYGTATCVRLLGHVGGCSYHLVKPFRLRFKGEDLGGHETRTAAMSNGEDCGPGALVVNLTSGRRWTYRGWGRGWRDEDACPTCGSLGDRTHACVVRSRPNTT